MQCMFYGCSNLESLDLSSFNTSQVQDMTSMFWNCGKLITLDLRSFDAEQTMYSQWMLSGCNGLEQVKMPKNIKSDVELPAVTGSVWQDANNTICTTAHKNLSQSMSYTRVSDSKQETDNESETDKNPTDTQPKPEDSPQPTPESKPEETPEKTPEKSPEKSPEKTLEVNIPKAVGTKIMIGDASYTVTSSDVANPTVAFDGLSNTQAKAFTVPATITYENVTYQVTTVSLGKNVTALGKNTFKNYKKLTKITIKSSKLKSVGKNALKGIHAKCKIKFR